MPRKLFSLAAALLVLGAAPLAHADQIWSNTPTTYQGVECCFQVDASTVGTAGTEVQVTVTLLNGATFFANTGGGNHPGFGFNLEGDPGAITVTAADPFAADWTFGSGASSASPNANNDPVTGTSPDLGSFDYQFNLNSTAGGGTSGKISSLTFDITDANGINFADFIANTSSTIFVADILGGDGGTGLSGIAGTKAVTPEPSSLLLLGTGIVGVAVLMRRRIAAVSSATKNR